MNDRFLKACRREPVDCTPVWFMRQAGRYMAEYRRLRAKHSILEMCKTPELAAEVTLQPIDRFPLDAAIIFADILLPLEPMGITLEFAEGEGPVIHNPVREGAAVDRLKQIDGSELQFVMDAISLTRKRLDGRVPLIGFAGAPFTLASYAIEYVKPHVQFIFDGLKDAGVPLIHFGTGTTAILKDMRQAGGDVIGVDWRVHLDDAWATIGHDRAVQGNLDPVTLFGPVHEIERRVADILRRAGGRPGHIFNLGHGILPNTPVEHVAATIEIVHKLSAR